MIVFISDHEEQAKGFLIEQYKGLPRTEGLLVSLVRRDQELEDVAAEVYSLRILENAYGVWLDTIGKLVGEARGNSPTDAVYQLRIRTRIRVNRSHGHPDDLIEVAALALDGTAFKYIEMYPASFVVDVLGELEAGEPAEVLRRLLAAKPAGVGGALHYSDEDEENTFTFAIGSVEQASNTQGFSGPSVPGGALASVATL